MGSFYGFAKAFTGQAGILQWTVGLGPEGEEEKVMRINESSRREFLATAGETGSGLLIASLSGGEPLRKKPAPEEEVAPAENLMREHGS